MEDLIPINIKKTKIKKVESNGDIVLKNELDGRFNKVEDIVDINGALKKRFVSAVNSKKGKGKMTAEVITLLKYAIAIGSSNKEACLLAGISQWNYYDWKKSYPKLFDNMEALRSMPMLKARASLFRNLDNIDTAKWFLERKNKGEFSIRTENVNANINANYDTLLQKIEGKGGDEVESPEIRGEVFEKMDLIYDVVKESSKRKKQFQAENITKNINAVGKNYSINKRKAKTSQTENTEIDIK
jgi:hypothetical protein